MRRKSVFGALLLTAVFAAPLCAVEPREAGFNNLIVIDPNSDERGLPSPVIGDGHVDIPPTLHIHPYYYSGDKEYQGPILNGGPTIIVANHPKTGEKLYVDAVLPAGAPIIAYDKNSITYVYKDRRVVIEYHSAFRDGATVKYVSGHGPIRRLQESLMQSKQSMNAASRQSRLVTEVKQLGQETGNLLKGSVGLIERAGAYSINRTRMVTKLIPGVQALQSAGDQAAERGAMEEIRQAGILQVEDQFVPTAR